MSASPEAIVTRMTSPDDAPASSMPAIDTCAGCEFGLTSRSLLVWLVLLPVLNIPTSWRRPSRGTTSCIADRKPSDVRM